MKNISAVVISILILCHLMTAAKADPMEAVKCYSIAWEHPNNEGLGLNRGQARRLCKGTKNAEKTIACFDVAWGHPDNGGMGLTKGGAIELCQACASDSQGG